MREDRLAREILSSQETTRNQKPLERLIMSADTLLQSVDSVRVSKTR